MVGMTVNSEWLSRFAFLSNENLVAHGFYPEEDFCELLQLETKRIQRHMRPAPLMQLNLCDVESCSQKQKVMRGMVSQLFSFTRKTDIKGWFREGSVIGVLFRERGPVDWPLALEAIMRRILVILDTVNVPHSAASWHLLTSSAAGPQGAAGERLETLQWGTSDNGLPH